MDHRAVVVFLGLVACSDDDVVSGGGSATGSSTGTSETSSSGGTNDVEPSTSSVADTTTSSGSSTDAPATEDSSSSDGGSDDSSSTGDGVAYLDEVVPGPDLLEPRRRPILLRLGDGTVYVGSGFGSDYTALTTVERFRPVEGDVVPAGNLLLARSNPCAVLLADGRVLVAGDSRHTEIWDPTAEASEEGPELNATAGLPMCMVDGDGVVYVADTWTDGKGYLVERWAPGVDAAFVELPSESELNYNGPRGATLFGDGGSMLLTGGQYSEKDDPPPLPGAPRVYDIDSGVFSLIQGWDGVAGLLVEANGNALLYYTNNVGFRAARLDHATMVLDAITPDGEVPRAPMAALRTDGVVVFAGGAQYVGPQDVEPVDALLLWDPSAETLTSIGTLAAPRGAGASLRLDDGSIAIVGGAGLDGPVATIEIYR